jgi:hypothetical protein
MLILERRERDKKAFVKKRMEPLYAILKNRMKDSTIATHSTQIVSLQSKNAQFGQFYISYDEKLSEYRITNSFGNWCAFTLGKTYISKYIDIKLYDVAHQFLLDDERHLPFFVWFANS